ncbi:MAG: hypothetical protein U0Y68_03665 [Blastocatellia bacterium]
MPEIETCAQGATVDELRKAVLSLRLAEVQQLVLNLPPVPPAKTVTITVSRDAKGRFIQIKQDWAKLMANEQIAWTSPDGRVEIRFSRTTSPFLGDMFEVARGGKAFSDPPVKRITQDQTYKYTILVTTPDGYFVSKEVDLVITPATGSKGKARAKAKNKKDA